ncbi:MAG: hypothetical protein GY851_30400, partial [bacterium]|nr:hypothetical protein [bacterium]
MRIFDNDDIRDSISAMRRRADIVFFDGEAGKGTARIMRTAANIMEDMI